jgi:2-keto-4-pentenoate hydratase/2-oxohepta-3-ene-1,7-dioic acid hydratase in catechol pathway
VQAADTADMIFTVAEIIEFLSASTTLPAGTVILTGTPSGVGMAADPPRWLRRGDTVEVEIEGIGVLRNPVLEESIPERAR